MTPNAYNVKSCHCAKEVAEGVGSMDIGVALRRKPPLTIILQIYIKKINLSYCSGDMNIIIEGLKDKDMSITVELEKDDYKSNNIRVKIKPMYPHIGACLDK